MRSREARGNRRSGTRALAFANKCARPLQPIRTVDLVVACAAIAAVTPLLAWWLWGAGAVAVGLIANFTATFAAFLVALGWDRRQRVLEKHAR